MGRSVLSRKFSKAVVPRRLLEQACPVSIPREMGKRCAVSTMKASAIMGVGAVMFMRAMCVVAENLMQRAMDILGLDQQARVLLCMS